MLTSIFLLAIVNMFSGTAVADEATSEMRAEVEAITSDNYVAIEADLLTDIDDLTDRAEAEMAARLAGEVDGLISIDKRQVAQTQAE